MIYPRRKKRGFTLIELLITILIIGVLAAIAVTAYHRYTIRTTFRTVLATLTMKGKLVVAHYFSQYGNCGPHELYRLPNNKYIDKYYVANHDKTYGTTRFHGCRIVAYFKSVADGGDPYLAEKRIRLNILFTTGSSSRSNATYYKCFTNVGASGEPISAEDLGCTYSAL